MANQRLWAIFPHLSFRHPLHNVSYALLIINPPAAPTPPWNSCRGTQVKILSRTHDPRRTSLTVRVKMALQHRYSVPFCCPPGFNPPVQLFWRQARMANISLESITIQRYDRRPPCVSRQSTYRGRKEAGPKAARTGHAKGPRRTSGCRRRCMT